MASERLVVSPALQLRGRVAITAAAPGIVRRKTIIEYLAGMCVGRARRGKGSLREVLDAREVPGPDTKRLEAPGDFIVEGGFTRSHGTMQAARTACDLLQNRVGAL